MKKVHMTLQGKGGVGKSFVASLLAQYYLEKNVSVTCLDADPVNATFSSYKAFNATHYDIMGKATNEVDMRKLEAIMEQVIAEDSHFIIDNGVASFLPMTNYLVGYGVAEILEQQQRELYIHTIVVGEQGLNFTLDNFVALAQQLPPQARLVVWLNEHFGEIHRNGKDFEQMKGYQQHKDKVTAIIRLPKQVSLFQRSMSAMLDSFLTFEEAINSAEMSVFDRQRLTMVRRSIFEQLETGLT